VGLDLHRRWAGECCRFADGNYPHNTDPTKFFSMVAQTHAYERDCLSSGNYDPHTGACQDPASVPESSVYVYCVDNGLVNDQRT
jgi:hypothetical protein